MSRMNSSITSGERKGDRGIARKRLPGETFTDEDLSDFQYIWKYEFGKEITKEEAKKHASSIEMSYK